MCERVCAPAGSSQCIFKRRGLTFILVFHSQAMGGSGRGEEEEEEGEKEEEEVSCAGLWNEVGSCGGFTHS